MPPQAQNQRFRFDFAPASPAESLAADEAILDWCESGQGGETLCFWEPRETFVVVGYANKVASEVNRASCEAMGIPIFRRCSGGGTVLQMAGGLNYSLILRITMDGPLQGITSANRHIMEQNRAALSSLLPVRSPLPEISVRGHTDLCLGNLKFAGNSQRRRKNYLLFHGTLLLDCNLQLISQVLPMPSLEPDYRDHRKHEDFLTNLKLPADDVKAALARVWNAATPLPHPPLEAVARLARERYSNPEWNFKF